jgi:hypothetical protein
MNSRKLLVRLATLAGVAAFASATAYGCSSGDNSNAGPSNHDGGNDATSSGSGSGSGGADSSGSSSGTDAPVIDTGSCQSDASTCNSCYTAAQAAQDPLNACAPETANCIPFTKTVPSHPTL